MQQIICIYFRSTPFDIFRNVAWSITGTDLFDNQFEKFHTILSIHFQPAMSFGMAWLAGIDPSRGKERSERSGTAWGHCQSSYEGTFFELSALVWIWQPFSQVQRFPSVNEMETNIFCIYLRTYTRVHFGQLYIDTPESPWKRYIHDFVAWNWFGLVWVVTVWLRLKHHFDYFRIYQWFLTKIFTTLCFLFDCGLTPINVTHVLWFPQWHWSIEAIAKVSLNNTE